MRELLQHFLKSTKNPLTLLPSTKVQPREGVFVMHVCNIRQHKLHLQMLTFLQLGPTATTQDRTHLAESILTVLPLSTFHSHHFLFFLRNWRPSCPAILFSLQIHHQSPLQHRCCGFCKHTTSEQRFTSWVVGCAEQNRRPPHTRPSPVAASPTDLGRGKHTHTSVRPTCYTSKPKNNSSCL